MQETDNASTTKLQIIAIDVYGTLLDMSELKRKVNNLLDSRIGYLLWFEIFMQYCFVDNCTIQFNDFISIAKATMQMTANKLDRKIDDYDIDNVLEILKHLPVHEGVQDGVTALADECFSIIALTN